LHVDDAEIACPYHGYPSTPCMESTLKVRRRDSCMLTDYGAFSYRNEAKFESGIKCKNNSP